MADTDAARIGDVKAGFVAAKSDANTRLKRDGSNVNMSSGEAAAFRAAIGAGSGGGGSGDVEGPASAVDGQVALFNGASGKLLKSGPLIGTGDAAGLLRQIDGDARYVRLDRVGVATGVAPLGADGKVPAVNLPASGAGGDVTGPSSSVDGYVAVFDGATGKLLKLGPRIGGNEDGADLLRRIDGDGRFRRLSQPIGIGEVSNLQTSLDGLQPLAAKGAANGYAPLDATGKVPEVNLPSSSGGPPLATTTPAAVGTAAVGSGTSAARDDHVHAHGNQAGGALHSAATTGANGFMSASDKSKLDGVAVGATANSPNSTLLNRANHTGTQAWGTITGAPAITELTATTAITANAVAQRDASGWLFAARFACNGGHYYFNTGGTVWIRYTDPNIVFSNSCTGPAFTPTSDPRLKDNMERVDDDAASLKRVTGIYQYLYTRKQDNKYAAGANAFDLYDLYPLWTVGGDPLPEDLETPETSGAVQDEDGSWVWPLGVDPMAIITDLAASVRELERRLALVEGDA